MKQSCKICHAHTSDCVCPQLEKDMLDMLERKKTSTNTHHCETCTCGIPKNGDRYFHIKIDGEIFGESWDGGGFDLGRLESGNVFRTKEAAQKALEAITKVLREADKG